MSTMHSWPLWLAVALGGGLGAGLRGFVMRVWDQGGRDAAAATLLVNAAGSFALGWTLAVAAGGGLSSWAEAGLTAGLCGSLTTFSTFCADLERAGTRRARRAKRRTSPPGGQGRPATSAFLLILAHCLLCLGAFLSGQVWGR